MSLTKFRCPDEVEIPISECLTKCRMSERCVTKATLLTIVSGRREWNGAPSTTQLLNGTMMEWLKWKFEYSVAPRDNAFALMGLAHHEKLSKVQGDWESEKQLRGESDRSGISDLLEPDENMPGYHVVTDYKNFGSYKVANILGLEKETKPHPTEKYVKSGPWGKAGTPKQVATFKENPNARDIKNEKLQLNHYRLLAERLGYKVSKLRLQITVRDGGTQAAFSRGIFQNMYYPVDIPIISNEEVESYFQPKAQALIFHINSNIMPPEPCNSEESWEDKRCLSYCEVAQLCPKGALVRWKEESKKQGGNTSG